MTYEKELAQATGRLADIYRNRSASSPGTDWQARLDEAFGRAAVVRTPRGGTTIAPRPRR